MSSDFIQNQIVEYFRGERTEMICILSVSSLMMALAATLYFSLRDSFEAGFAVTVVISALLFSGTALSLLNRDQRLRDALLSSMSQTEDKGIALSLEKQRMTRVLENYPSYRWAAIGIVLVTLVVFAFWPNPRVAGVLAGLLLVACSQIMIDHYSERRAMVYREALDSFSP